MGYISIKFNYKHCFVLKYNPITKKEWVQLCWTGYYRPPIHGRYPTTAPCGSFCLLCFHPGPVRFSLDNLVTLSSPKDPILTPCLVRTPNQHRQACSRTPALKPSTKPSLQVAGLQEHATTPSCVLRQSGQVLQFVVMSSELLANAWHTLAFSTNQTKLYIRLRF